MPKVNYMSRYVQMSTIDQEIYPMFSMNLKIWQKFNKSLQMWCPKDFSDVGSIGSGYRYLTLWFRRESLNIFIWSVYLKTL